MLDKVLTWLNTSAALIPTMPLKKIQLMLFIFICLYYIAADLPITCCLYIFHNLIMTNLPNVMNNG
jgi:hypothetical protein